MNTEKAVRFSPLVLRQSLILPAGVMGAGLAGCLVWLLLNTVSSADVWQAAWDAFGVPAVPSLLAAAVLPFISRMIHRMIRNYIIFTGSLLLVVAVGLAVWLLDASVTRVWMFWITSAGIVICGTGVYLILFGFDWIVDWVTLIAGALLTMGFYVRNLPSMTSDAIIGNSGLWQGTLIDYHYGNPAVVFDVPWLIVGAAAISSGAMLIYILVKRAILRNTKDSAMDTVDFTDLLDMEQ